MPGALQPIANYVVGALIVSGFIALVRWAVKVDKGLSNTVKQSELLTARLDGHEALSDARHQAAETAIERLYDMALASNGPRR